MTGVFSRTLRIETSVADLQPLVMCTADSQVTRPFKNQDVFGTP
jgi:hypothetical protein